MQLVARHLSRIGRHPAPEIHGCRRWFPAGRHRAGRRGRKRLNRESHRRPRRRCPCASAGFFRPVRKRGSRGRYGRNRGGQVDWHGIDVGGEVAAIVRVEATQEIPVGLAAAACGVATMPGTDAIGSPVHSPGQSATCCARTRVRTRRRRCRPGGPCGRPLELVERGGLRGGLVDIGIGRPPAGMGVQCRQAQQHAGVPCGPFRRRVPGQSNPTARPQIAVPNHSSRATRAKDFSGRRCTTNWASTASSSNRAFSWNAGLT